MDKIKLIISSIIIIIIIICAIYLTIYIYTNATQKEPFYQGTLSNPISIVNTASLLMKETPENPFLKLIDNTKTAISTAILRFNGTKWEPYEYARFSYRVTSTLKLTTEFKKLLSTEAYGLIDYDKDKIFDTKNIFNTGGSGKVTFTEINSKGNGEITINPACKYKITLNMTTYINTIVNNVTTELDVYIYGYDTISDTDVILGSCVTYIYSVNRFVAMSIIAFVDNKNTKLNITKIIPKIRLRPRPTFTITYTQNIAPDTTVNIAIEEY